MRGLDLPTQGRPLVCATRYEASILTRVQAKAFLTYLIGHRHEALLTVALTMRLRRGEILASRWCDLDLEKTQLLKVLHSRERVKHSRSPSQKHESEARPPASPTLASRL